MWVQQQTVISGWMQAARQQLVVVGFVDVKVHVEDADVVGCRLQALRLDQEQLQGSHEMVQDQLPLPKQVPT